MSPASTNREVEVSRRRFLAGVGTVAGVVAGGYAVDVWGRPLTAGATPAPAKARAARRRTLVVVELAGGNDGIATVVPYTDPDYKRLRPTLAVDDPIDLDGRVGLTPELAKLAARYRAGQVAIVEGVGYPNSDLSHFASLANWWTGHPGEAGATGWLGRYLDATVGFRDPLAGVVVGPGPSPALLGARSFATSISDASGLEPRVPSWITRSGDLVDRWARLGSTTADRRTLTGQVRDAIDLTTEARAELDRALRDRPRAASDDALTTQAYDGQNTVLASFDIAARLVTSARPPRVVYVTNLGDYDTHQGEAQRHPALMRDLDAGLDHLLSALDTAGVADRVVVMTVSEFGRRAQENGSGTDHGAASAHFVMGTRVKGGRYGRPASLTQLDARGNLPFGVDFRSVYATALEGWLGVDAEPILGPGFAAQPVFM